MTNHPGEPGGQAQRFGALPDRPGPDDIVGAADNLVVGSWPINGLRHLPAGGTSGWYLWAGEELGQDGDFFKPLHVKHLEHRCVYVIPYLDLPAGWRFLITPGYEDVWYDPALLVE